MGRPNVLLLMTDQHRADCLGCYGNGRVHTPHIDRLASDGVRVDRAYVTNPLCTPSRSSILTGRSVSGHGVWNLGVPLQETVRTLPGFLAGQGYRTAALGKVHLTPQVAGCPEFPENVDFWASDPDWTGPYYGFEEVRLFVGHTKLIGHYGQYIRRQYPELADKYEPQYALEEPTGAPNSWKSGFPVAQHSCTWICEQALAFLHGYDGRPFFAQCSFPFPHFPFSPPAPYCYQYDLEDMVLPERRAGDLEGKPPHVMGYYRSGGGGQTALCDVTEAQMREVVAHTYGMIGFVDDLVGRILDTLEGMGLAEDTIVIFCSDHGELLWDHGLLKKGPYPYEGLLRVPLIWRWPAGLPAGGATNGLFSLSDLTPTILSCLGLAPWEGVEGVDQTPVLRGDARSVRDAVLTEYYHGKTRPEDGLRLKTLTTERWRLTHYAGEAFGELYDLVEDPGEFVNLYRRPEYAGVRARLTGELVDALGRSDARFGSRLAPA